MNFEKAARIAASAAMCAALVTGLAVISSTPGIDDGAGLEHHTK